MLSGAAWISGGREERGARDFSLQPQRFCSTCLQPRGCTALPDPSLPRLEWLVLGEGFVVVSSLTVTNDFIQQNGSVRGIILALLSQTAVVSPT